MNGVTAKKIATVNRSDKCNGQDPEDVLAGIEADLAGLTGEAQAVRRVRLKRYAFRSNQSCASSRHPPHLKLFQRFSPAFSAPPNIRSFHEKTRLEAVAGGTNGSLGLSVPA